MMTMYIKLVDLTYERSIYFAKPIHCLKIGPSTRRFEIQKLDWLASETQFLFSILPHSAFPRELSPEYRCTAIT